MILRALNDVKHRASIIGKKAVNSDACSYEKVDVIRKARLRMDQILNAMGMEGGQKVFVVVVHPVSSPNP